MYKTMTVSDMARDLIQDEFAGWTPAGAYALAEWFDQIEPQLEWDPVAVRCDFSEYESAAEAAAQYSDNPMDEAEALEYLQEQTMVITFTGGVIIADF